MDRLAGERAPLTPRDWEVLDLVRRGLTDEQVASRLDVSPASVRYHKSQIASKLDESGLGEPAATTRPLRGETAKQHPRRPRWRLTPIMLLALAVVLPMTALYVWGVFFYDDGVDKGILDIEWLQVDAPSPDPPEQLRGSSPPSSEQEPWRLYVLEGSGEPRMVFESDKRLFATAWSADGQKIIAAFYAPTSRTTVSGRMAISAGTGEVLWEQSVPASSAVRGVSGGERYALMDTRRSPSSTGVYVVEADGTSRQLSGSWEIDAPMAWSPDGSRLLVNRSDEGMGVSRSDGFEDYYVVTPYEDEALAVGRYSIPPVWSPDGRRLAGFDGIQLAIFDLEKRREIRVDVGGVSSLPQGPGVLTSLWSADSRFLNHAGAVVESASGKILTPTEPGFTLSSVSPDGRWVAMASDSTACQGAASSRPPANEGPPLRPNQTVLKEVGTGRKLVLVDCDKGRHSAYRWLGPSSLLLSGNACPVAGCSRPGPSFLLASIPSGDLQLLSDPSEPGAFGLAVSADGRRIATGGRALRVFAADGSLLRTIPAPQGMMFTAMSWTAVGARLAYISGPTPPEAPTRP